MQKNGKRYFTQRELERHINSRLMREKKKNSELEALKSMADALIEKGIIDADSYAVAAEKLYEIAAESAVGNKEGDSCGVCEDAPAEAVDKTADLKQEDCYDKGDAPADVIDGDGENYEEDKDVSCANLMAGDADFATEDIARLSGLCRRFLALAERAENCEKSGEESSFRARRDACSTGFSGKCAAYTPDGGNTLTPLQREIARKAGISYREYAALLRDIPVKMRNRRI